MFEYMDAFAEKKTGTLQKHPNLVSFSMRAFYNGGIQIGSAMDRYMVRMTDALFEKYLGRVDKSKFKPGCTPRQAVDLLIYLTDGYLHTQSMSGKQADMAELYGNLRGWQDMVRVYMYKEEYL